MPRRLPPRLASLRRGVSRAPLALLLTALSGTPALAAPAPPLDQPVVSGVGAPLPPLPAAAPAPAGATDKSPVAFEADRVEYSDNGDVVTARGSVFLRRDDQTVRADTVTWDRKSGQIVATGNIRAVDQDGNQVFSDRMELTDELKTGAMDDLLMLLREGGRLAASHGQREADGKLYLSHAAFTGCDVVDSRGCPKQPSWRITARRVIYDPDRKLVSFHGARLSLFGALPIPLPGFDVATDGRSLPGFFIPDFRLSASNGLELSETYYDRIAANRDLAVTGYVFSQVDPMVEVQYRALTTSGAYQVTGYATRSPVIPQSSTGTGVDQFRGYLDANGKFQLSPDWSIDFSGRLASDRTFLSRYYINGDDRLRSTVDVDHITANSYLSIAGWAFQTLRSGESSGLVPIALPEIDYRLRLADPLLGGKIEIQADSLAITRSAGQDTQRAFTSAQWSMQSYTSLGQVLTLTALLRGDAYHSANNQLTSTAVYQGLPGWQARGVALLAADMTWPLVGAAFGGTQVLTPHIQLVGTPPTPNMSIPNEDARATELEDDNLFALNRFPGYDRVEDGVRFTYGVDWQLEIPRWRVNATIGQSYRLTNNSSQFPDGTGLYDRVSDIVGRTEIEYSDVFKITHRYRVDKDTFAFRRNEIDATIGDANTYVEVGYARLNRNIAAALDDLQNSNELRAAARVSFARYWSVFGSGVFDLSNDNLLTDGTTNPFQPLRTRLGVAFQSDCFEFDMTWRRDYITIGDATRGSSFLVHFALRKLGFR